jgi:DHA1 family multidrug resistance protein-like MFS transporter
LLIFVAYLNYLTDTYLMYTASAMAANTICRSACGAAAPLFTKYMFDALGVGGGGSLIGGFAVLLAPIPFIFYRYGEPIRKRSKFAPTPEKTSNEKQESSDEPEPGRSDSSQSDSSPSIDSEQRPEQQDSEKSDERLQTETGGQHSGVVELDKDIEKGNL